MDDAAAFVGMSHVLILTSEMAGRINVSCELARRLDAIGHRATVASSSDISHRARSQGIEAVQLRHGRPRAPSPTQPSGLLRVRAFVGRLAAYGSIAERRQAKVDALDPGGFITEIQELGPDLVLADVELAMQIMTVTAAGIPLMTWTTMLSLWKRPGLPPLGSDIVVGTGIRGSRLGLEWSWLSCRVWKWLRNVRFRITRSGEDQLSVLRSLAAQVGFDTKRQTDAYQWLVPFVYQRLPLLVFNAAALEFPHEPHPTVRYVGPVLNVERRNRATAPQREVTERLEALYVRRASGDTEALLYCSFGAWHKGDDGSFIEQVIAAAAQHPQWDLVLGLGERLADRMSHDMPDNVHVFAWAPQMEVLAHADVAIHHAGISSVNESIVSGVPMVLYPFDFLDQPGNAARVAYHGMGVVGDRKRDIADDIAALIRLVLDDASYKSNVVRMAEAFADVTASDPAVKAITDELDAPR